MILVKGEFVQSGMYFFPEIFYNSPGASVHHEKQSSPCRMFVLFYVGGDMEKWGHAISS